MDYRSAVNPTYLTAKSTVLMLAGAGNQDAARMIGALGTQDDLVNTSREKNGNGPFTEADAQALMMGVTVSVEARYAAVSRLLKAEGYKNLLDIACGYTPRAIYCAREGIDYVGLDVPVVAEELSQVAPKVGIQSPHLTYVAGDATNAASLAAAADLMEGELLISCEGLLSYLFEDEAAQLIAGIREILLDHGGAWVTSDMGVDYEKFAVLAMKSPDAAKLYQESRRQSTGASNIYNEGVAYRDEATRQQIMEAGGLKVEKIPFYHGDEGLAILEKMPEALQAGYKGLLAASCLWKMTVDTSFDQAPAIEGAKQVDNLEVRYSVEGDTLLCQVSGRVDTISAPALLEVFETAGAKVSSIEVDATKLQYISSAGLRVLMMAAKRVGPDKVVIKNASAAVRDIFETTGFDQILTVI